MKNILARGGIEFLAVLLGLSGSLWVDNSIKENENKVQNRKILTRLYNNLISDSTDGEWLSLIHISEPTRPERIGGGGLGV